MCKEFNKIEWHLLNDLVFINSQSAPGYYLLRLKSFLSEVLACAREKNKGKLNKNISNPSLK